MPTVARSIAARRSCHRNGSHLKRWRRWAVVLLLVTGSACSYAPPQPAGFSTPTVDASPSGSPSPTDTALPAPPAPTPVAAWQLSVEDAASLAELQTLLVGVTLEALDTARGSFDQANPECLLLVPEGSDSQRSLLLVDGEGRSFAAANLNVPLMAVRDAPQPRFNEKDSALVMRWEDASGHRFYHCPLREDQIGRPLAVYQRNNELFEAFVGADGRIEAKSERPFWQAVPSEAKNIALVKFDRAVYLTFWRADGQQIESARIRVNSLPAIPTPEPTETVLTADVEVFSYDFDGKKVVIANQARLNEAKDHVFRKMFGQTTGWVNALLPRSLPDQNNWHNIPVTLDLSKGMKVIFYNIDKLSPQETVKYHEGVGIIHVVTSRYDVDETDRLVIEMFVDPESARAAPIYLSYALTRLRDLKIDSDSDLVLFEILVGSPRPKNDELVDLSKFSLQLR